MYVTFLMKSPHLVISGEMMSSFDIFSIFGVLLRENEVSQRFKMDIFDTFDSQCFTGPKLATRGESSI